MQLQLSEEREAQLNDYAQRRNQAPAAALDEILADALTWERREYEEAVAGIRRGYADMQAGRTRSLNESFGELRERHGLSR